MTSRFDKWIKMVDFKLGNEMWKVNWSTRHKRGTKKILRKFWVRDRNRIDDTQTHGGCSIHWAMRTHVFGGVWVQFLLGTENFLFPSLMSCWSIHLSHFITELKIHHDYSWWLWQCWSYQNAGCLSLMNSVKWPCSPCSSVDRAPTACSGGHEFDSCRGLRIFSLYPTLLSCWLVDLY